MTFGDLFKKWKLESINLTVGFASIEFAPTEDDQVAAWDMYVELVTRTTTQPLQPETGDEKKALESVYSLFETTRNILKEKGRKADQFTKIAIIVLNQIVRPFTAIWHKKELDGAFNDLDECRRFREDLKKIQKELRAYTGLLASIADVENLTEISQDRSLDCPFST